MEKKYHGHTLNQINEKYYIKYDGTDDLPVMYRINSKLTRYWQEVAYFYMDSKRLLANAEGRLRRLDVDTELLISEKKNDLIIENKSLPKNERWSDKARETVAIQAVMDTNTKKLFRDIKDEIGEFKVEVAIWHEVRQNLRFVSQRIDNTTMGMGVEAKITKNLSVDPIDKYTKEEPIPEAIFAEAEEADVDSEKKEKEKEYCKKAGIENMEELPF